jgi:transcription elongation GreA/GreB family factor
MAKPQRHDKAKMLRALTDALVEARDRVLAAQRTSVEGVTHEDAKSEGDKDMRATEASYVARGQAMRVEALDADVAKVAALRPRVFEAESPIALGALVTIEERGAKRLVLIAPAGGGIKLASAGQAVHVVTPSSPLGRALVGARAGDDVSLERDGREQDVAVVAIE